MKTERKDNMDKKREKEGERHLGDVGDGGEEEKNNERERNCEREREWFGERKEKREGRREKGERDMDKMTRKRGEEDMEMS